MLDKLIRALQKPFETVDKRIVVHNDYNVVGPTDINYKPPLARNVINQTILDKYDFIEFVNEYKNDQTKLFYNEKRLKAVFNYPGVDKADYADSYCSMPLVETLEYIEFSRALNGKLSQKTFIHILKRLEPFIIAFDGKQVDDMDIIEVAENLQATKNINSVQRNTQQKFTLDVEVTAGNSQMVIPRYITFAFPVYKNDLQLKTEFTAELFLSSGEDGFEATLMCYKLEQLTEEALKELTKQVQKGLDGVDSFMS